MTFDSAKLIAELAEIQIPDTPLGSIFRDKKIEIRRKIQLLESIGTPDFSEKSRQLYGFPSAENIEIARKILAQKPRKFSPEKSTIDAKSAAAEFEKFFAKYELENWRVVLRDELVSDALAGKSGTLFIRTDARFSAERLRSLIAHEVETHILRGENGRVQKYEIFSRGTGDYLEIEEGLAIFNQNSLLPKNHEKQFWSVVGFLAVAESAEKSFRGIFNFVRKSGFSADRAWKTAVKIKRGLAETSAAGGFTKEAIYFSGFRKIQKFVDDGGDLRKLYLGKIKISDLEVLEKISEIHSSKILPEFYAD